MALNCKARAHRKYWVANICLACLVPIKPRQWSPLWREARWTLYAAFLLLVTALLLIGVR